MSKYIEQEKLLSRMLTNSKLSIDGNENYVTVYGFSKEDIESECTVDAVEVVRCKDCVHYTSYCCHYHEADKDGMPVYMNKEDFCSYGERKE